MSNESKISLKKVGNDYILTCEDGTVHTLTNLEKLWMKFGFLTLQTLEEIHNNERNSACKRG